MKFEAFKKEVISLLEKGINHENTSKFYHTNDMCFVPNPTHCSRDKNFGLNETIFEARCVEELYLKIYYQLYKYGYDIIWCLFNGKDIYNREQTVEDLLYTELNLSMDEENNGVFNVCLYPVFMHKFEDYRGKVTDLYFEEMTVF